LYFDLRVSREVKTKQFSVEVIHHKFYLENPPEGVQHFEVSHGYNIVIINYGKKIKEFVYRAGGGIVLAHGESMVRGLEYPSKPGFDPWNYHIAGPAINLSVSRPFVIRKNFFLNTEFKINAAAGRVPIVNGYAKTRMVIFQLCIGPGFRFH
jgi:hypothetical protein